MAFVRVKLQNGDETTIGERAVRAFGATVIDKPAVDEFGRPLPAKLNIHKGGTLAIAKSAKRDEIEAYAVEHGGFTAEEASAFASKADLFDALAASAADDNSEEN